MEARYYLRSEMKAPETISLACGTLCIHSAPGPGLERSNEDGALLLTLDDDRLVLALADGAGGYRGSQQVAGIALGALARHLERAEREEERIRDAILDGIEAANRILVRRGIGAATTLAVAQIHGRRVRTCHVGDSQILLTGQRGRVKLLTVPHSPTGYAVEAGWLGEGEALQHEDRHLISNLVGREDMHVEVRSEQPIAPRDTLLLGSDGLFDNVRIEEIVEIVRAGPLASATRHLVRASRRRMSGVAASQPAHPDDLTVLLYRPRGSGHAEADRQSPT